MKDIKEAKSDEHLLKMLSAELQKLLPEEMNEDLNILVQSIRKLPRGLRAMAATHRLDVSMAINDLGWHFFNNYNWEFSDETQFGLQELNAHEAAAIFARARELIKPHWEKIGQIKTSAFSGFADWYKNSGLEAALLPFNKKMWEICSTSKDYGLMAYWLSYARNHPEQVLEN